MRVAVFGNGRAASLSLQSLVDFKSSDEIRGVAPPGGRHHMWHDSFEDACIRLGVQCAIPENVNSEDQVSALASFQPDVIFSVGYTQILKSPILALPEHAINFHPSLLPNYRGVAPLIRAIVNGDTEAGVTAHEMTLDVDRGKIYRQIRVDIGDDDTGFSLHQKVADATRDVFLSIYDDIVRGRLVGYAMPDGGSLFTTRSPRVNRLMPAEQSMRQIQNIVRALASPLPNAFVDTDEGRFEIDAVDRHVPEAVEEFLTDQTAFGLYRVDSTWYLKTRDGSLRLVSARLAKEKVPGQDGEQSRAATPGNVK